MKDKKYFVNERFHAFQGEGVHMGLPAFFIRLHGCPVKCPWCDSAGTWHPFYKPKNVEQFTPEQLADEAVKELPSFVVITGGEPAIHDLRPLCDALIDRGLAIHLETSGGFKLQGYFDWVTLSPKKWGSLLPEAVKQADEFKVIVESEEDILLYLKMLNNAWPGLDGDGSLGLRQRPSIWLHPEWSQHRNPEVLSAISQAVKQGVGRFRAGWQLHKLYRVDNLDLRARQPVPLGGDVTKGF